MNFSKFDYSELNKQHSLKDIATLNESIFSSKSNLIYSIQKFLPLIISIFFIQTFIIGWINEFMYQISFQGFSKFELLQISLLILFFAAVIYLLYLLYKRISYQNKLLSLRLYNFAINNNLIYAKNVKNDKEIQKLKIYMPSLGLIFNLGYGKNLRYVIGNDLFSIGSYEFITGYGKTLQRHIWTISAVNLSKKLPHILLEPKKKSVLNILTGQFTKDQLINAEPALSDNFNLYAPTGYHIDSLSFIAPDLIDVLKRNFTEKEIEIIDNTLYIYDSMLLNEQSIKNMLNKIEILANALEDNIDNYKDSRINDKSQSVGYLDPYQTIAPQGQRLKLKGILFNYPLQKPQWILIVVAIIIILITFANIILSYLIAPLPLIPPSY